MYEEIVLLLFRRHSVCRPTRYVLFVLRMVRTPLPVLLFLRVYYRSNMRQMWCRHAMYAFWPFRLLIILTSLFTMWRHGTLHAFHAFHALHALPNKCRSRRSHRLLNRRGKHDENITTTTAQNILYIHPDKWEFIMQANNIYFNKTMSEK